MPQLASKLSEYRTTADAVVLAFYFDTKQHSRKRVLFLYVGYIT